jgi:GMP synthase (glutamine-hydrolysing)
LLKLQVQGYNQRVAADVQQRLFFCSRTGSMRTCRKPETADAPGSSPLCLKEYCMKFLISDGYSAASRAKLAEAGMTYAWQLYADMLLKYIPDAEYEVFFPSDSAVEDFPGPEKLLSLRGIIWTGADLTIYETWKPTIQAQIDMARTAYELGVDAWGSCWGIQMAAAAAGGTVVKNPRGREMGIGRKIAKTAAGMDHPMLAGKPPVYYGFESHYDIVGQVPEGAEVLSRNPFSGIQAMTVTCKKGTFWATQYHPEYNLHEIARLTTARAQVLIEHGFFSCYEDLSRYVGMMEDLHRNPGRFDLLWQLGIDEDITDDAVRQSEFSSWLKYVCSRPVRREEA